MFNRLEALRYFVTAAELLHFRETAVRMSVSPQVVTRVIAELETALGDSLFKRNSRSIRLTEFGQQVLPRAQQLLADSEALFSGGKALQSGMSGLVRVALPRLPDYPGILGDLFGRLADYPEIVLDWRVDSVRMNITEDQIDLGVRVGPAHDGNLIVRDIATMRDCIIASPVLVRRLGKPASLDDLQQRYPLASLFNVQTGRPWGWHFNERQGFVPRNPQFLATDSYSALQAVLSGRACACLLDGYCMPEIRAGKVVELLPDIERNHWTMYVYRPYRSLTPARVLLVFDMLTDILRARFG